MTGRGGRDQASMLRQTQKLEAIGRLASSIAHDFNNALAIIRAALDLLERSGRIDGDRDRHVAAISDTVTRASKLTARLLDVAREDSGTPTTFMPGRSLRDLMDVLHAIMGPGVTITAAYPERPCFVHADASQFDIALINMAVNARDAMEGRGTLALALRPVDTIPPRRGHRAKQRPSVAISLTDTGPGIPPDQLKHIFEPFFTTKERGEGTGLGLSQVLDFTRRAGGDIAVETAPGAGTTFTIYLPQAADPFA